MEQPYHSFVHFLVYSLASTDSCHSKQQDSTEYIIPTTILYLKHPPNSDKPQHQHIQRFIQPRTFEKETSKNIKNEQKYLRQTKTNTGFKELRQQHHTKRGESNSIMRMTRPFFYYESLNHFILNTKVPPFTISSCEIDFFE